MRGCAQNPGVALPCHRRGSVSEVWSTKPDYRPTWESAFGLRADCFYRPVSHIDVGATFTCGALCKVLKTPLTLIEAFVRVLEGEDVFDLGEHDLKGVQGQGSRIHARTIPPHLSETHVASAGLP